MFGALSSQAAPAGAGGGLAIEKTRAFFTSMGLPSTLREVGIGEEKLPLMAKKAYGPRFDNTFVPLSRRRTF